MARRYEIGPLFDSEMDTEQGNGLTDLWMIGRPAARRRALS